MKGILLAGGSGSRLYPTTKAISKQLLPIYNKPLIFYPLTTLMRAGIREVLVISTADDLPLIRRLLGSGSDWGMSLEYAVQPAPKGIAQAFVLGSDFISGEGCALALGDNLHFGMNMTTSLRQAAQRSSGATVFACKVPNPSDYGVLDLSPSGRPLAIVEKPLSPVSNLAVTGVYFYDREICDIASALKSSPRGELEITDVNNAYLEAGKLHVEIMCGDSRWFDAGTYETMLESSKFVRDLEIDTATLFGCPATLAWEKGWIDDQGISDLSEKYGRSPYASYLSGLISNVAHMP